MAWRKMASACDAVKTAALMSRLYNEDPSKWPNGLSLAHFSPENIFLIAKEGAEKDPVGFVGWQEYADKGGKKVGCYSIGVLPEHRRKGYAQEAVGRILMDKAAGVDRIVALVVSGNESSIKLAEKLGVPVSKIASGKEKQASIFSWLSKLSPKWLGILSGTVSSAAMDQLAYQDQGALGFLRRFLTGKKEEYKGGAAPLVDFLVNAAAFGGTAGSTKRLLMSRGGLQRGAAGFLEPYQKALHLGTAVSGVPVALATTYLPMYNRTATALKDALSSQGMTVGGKLVPWWALAGAAGAGLTGTALLSRSISRAAEKFPSAFVSGGGGDGMGTRGRMRVALPTKAVGDVETVLEIPFDEDVELSNTLRKRLTRDVRRRLRAETGQRTYSPITLATRDPKRIQAIVD